MQVPCFVQLNLHDCTSEFWVMTWKVIKLANLLLKLLCLFYPDAVMFVKIGWLSNLETVHDWTSWCFHNWIKRRRKDRKEMFITWGILVKIIVKSSILEEEIFNFSLVIFIFWRILCMLMCKILSWKLLFWFLET